MDKSWIHLLRTKCVNDLALNPYKTDAHIFAHRHSVTSYKIKPAAQRIFSFHPIHPPITFYSSLQNINMYVPRDIPSLSVLAVMLFYYCFI